MSETVAVGVPPFPTRVGERDGCLDKPVIALVRKLHHGDLDGVSDDDLAFANLVVDHLYEATGRYAVRAIVERGWPYPTRERCRLSKNLYRRGLQTLREAHLITAADPEHNRGKRGEAEQWLVTRDKALDWLNK